MNETNNDAITDNNEETNNDVDDNFETNNDTDNTEKRENSPRKYVYVDIDYNGILSDSESEDDDDDDYGKRKKKYKKTPDKKMNKKCKLATSEMPIHGSKKLEIHSSPENIYIPDGWSRRVFQRLTGKYP